MFFKKEEIKNNNFLTKVCALLIHAAKIDENYTDKEEEIIKKTLNELIECFFNNFFLFICIILIYFSSMN